MYSLILTFTFDLVLGLLAIFFWVMVRCNNCFRVSLYSWATLYLLCFFQFWLLVLTWSWSCFFTFWFPKGLFLFFLDFVLGDYFLREFCPMEFFYFWIFRRFYPQGLCLKEFCPNEFLTFGFWRFCPMGFCSRELYEFWFLGDFFQLDYILGDFI